MSNAEGLLCWQDQDGFVTHDEICEVKWGVRGEGIRSEVHNSMCAHDANVSRPDTVCVQAWMQVISRMQPRRQKRRAEPRQRSLSLGGNKATQGQKAPLGKKGKLGRAKEARGGNGRQEGYLGAAGLLC